MGDKFMVVNGPGTGADHLVIEEIISVIDGAEVIGSNNMNQFLVSVTSQSDIAILPVGWTISESFDKKDGAETVDHVLNAATALLSVRCNRFTPDNDPYMTALQNAVIGRPNDPIRIALERDGVRAIVSTPDAQTAIMLKNGFADMQRHTALSIPDDCEIVSVEFASDGNGGRVKIVRDAEE